MIDPDLHAHLRRQVGEGGANALDMMGVPGVAEALGEAAQSLAQTFARLDEFEIPRPVALALLLGVTNGVCFPEYQGWRFGE
jgi:hypothetical protein